MSSEEWHNKLVIKNNKYGLGIDVGWRVPCSDGFYDLMWGNTKDNDTLVLLLKDAELKYGKREIVDERLMDES